MLKSVSIRLLMKKNQLKIVSIYTLSENQLNKISKKTILNILLIYITYAKLILN